MLAGLFPSRTRYRFSPCYVLGFGPAYGARPPHEASLPGHRHGTVLPVAGAGYERLLRRYGRAQPTKYVGFGSLYVRSA